MEGRSPHGERGLKYAGLLPLSGMDQSLSSWRAWIEIRNRPNLDFATFGRSPHGERGLKCHQTRSAKRLPEVALLMESVD